MTATKTQFDPYQTTLLITNDPNQFYAKSSNGVDWYLVVLTGEGAAICSCIGFEQGKPCRHRRAALARFPYMTATDEISDAKWDELLLKIEAEADKDAYDEMMEQEAA